MRRVLFLLGIIGSVQERLRIKNEMFYNADWSGVNISEFIGILNDYLYWYNEKRIKKSLGYLSPIEYRHRLGLVT